MAAVIAAVRPVRDSASMPRLLIIEDNEDLAFGLRRTFESEGYEVLSANAGQSGLSMAIDHRPALIILDLTLAGSFDGFRTLKAIRES